MAEIGKGYYQSSKWTSAGLAEKCGRESNCVCNRGMGVPRARSPWRGPKPPEALTISGILKQPENCSPTKFLALPDPPLYPNFFSMDLH